MIKKVLISFIAVFYLAVTSGVIVNIHYCMGRISSVSFGHDADHEKQTSNICSMENTESNCCRVDVKKVKLNDLHEASTCLFDLASVSTQAPVQFTLLYEAEQGVSAAPSVEYISPPPKVLNKVYLDVNVFRI